MKLPRRNFLHLAACATVLPTASRFAWAQAYPTRPIAAEFVRLRAAVIVTNYSGAFAAKQATSVIPIIFVLGNDPVGSGLVASLARPGGNVPPTLLARADEVIE